MTRGRRAYNRSPDTGTWLFLGYIGLKIPYCRQLRCLKVECNTESYEHGLPAAKPARLSTGVINTDILHAVSMDFIPLVVDAGPCRATGIKNLSELQTLFRVASSPYHQDRRASTFGRRHVGAASALATVVFNRSHMCNKSFDPME